MSEQDEAEDAFQRGYHGIPSEAELRNMLYVQLCSMLSSTETGSAKFMILDAEKRRRDLLEDRYPGPVGDAQPAKKWYERELGKLGVAIFAGVVVLCLTIIFREHLGIS